MNPEEQDEQTVLEEQRVQLPQGESVTWSAVEYIAREKTASWYVLFILICLLLIAVDIFFMRSWTFSALVVVMAASLIIYSNRPARTIDYTLSSAKGLYIGEQLHPLTDYKSFGLLMEDGIYSIYLIPVKRFAMGVSVYFPQESGEQIVDILGEQLPMQDLQLDIIDKLVRRLRL